MTKNSIVAKMIKDLCLEFNVLSMYFRERVMNTTRLEANVQHLKPDTQYEVRVVAYNRAGPSREHAEFTVKTEKEGGSHH